MPRRHATHRPDERPGGQPAPTWHQGHGCLHGHDHDRDRHAARQLHLRRLQVPLPLSRTPHHGALPDEAPRYARLPAGRRRVSLHLAVGLRFPALLPPHCRDPRGAPDRRPRAGPHRHGYPADRRRRAGEAPFPRPQRPPQELRPTQPHLPRPPLRRQAEPAHSHPPAHARIGRRLRPQPPTHRRDRLCAEG